MKNIFIFFALSFLFFSFSSYAAESGLQGFAQSILDFFSDFWEAITEGIPNLLQRLAAWAFEAAVFLKFLLYLESIKFAWGVAKLVLEDLSISSTLSQFFGALPPTARAILVDIRFPDAVNVILNAYVTKAVLRFM
jgi:hypothetical protein